MLTVQNGKGSGSRIGNLLLFKRRFEEIDWRRTLECPNCHSTVRVHTAFAVCPECRRPMGMHARVVDQRSEVSGQRPAGEQP